MMDHPGAMSDLRIEGAMRLDGGKADIFVHEGKIVDEAVGTDDVMIDGRGLLAMPGLCNTHTHAAMTLLKGCGEGLELDEWLNRAIWPLERRMRREHIEAGMRLACLEMIATGTTCFNDMYFMEDLMAPVVRDMGLRAFLGEGFIDLFDPDRSEKERSRVFAITSRISEEGRGLVRPSMAPHAVYTVSAEGLKWCRDHARCGGMPLHLHASETSREVSDLRSSRGRTPIGYLSDLGILGPDAIVAHAVHLSDEDLDVLGSSGASVSFNAISNMKLSSGGPMRFIDLRERGVNITVGTDGSASNNSLDMFQAMKFSSLVVKATDGASSLLPSEMIACATRNGYKALGVRGGSLAPGNVADIVLLDLDHISMVPGNDLPSNIVFSASPEAVRYTIVDGRVLMEDRKVEGAGGIIQKAKEMAQDLKGGV